MIKFALLTLALLLPVSMLAKVVGKTVEYKAGNVTLKGYLAYDSALKGKRPGVLVIHEWWGLNDYPKKRAEMLAKLGYVAFAADMYGDGKVVDNPGDAQKAAGESMKDLDLYKSKFVAALELLKQDERVDPARIAAIGYCYGGGVVLNMARAGVDLQGVVSFHGSLGGTSPAEKGKVKAKVLVCAGAADKFISPKDIDAFKAEMKNAGVDLKYVAYDGALHAFSNPDATALGKKFSIPIAYNEKADKGSWSEMQKFFKQIFKM
ncbi:MAG TPA: dienelactone hydrolase family protein [Bacteroidota bacterium]|nr:dienelactone hydrolase family protein [Bacteroidota bacterium]